MDEKNVQDKPGHFSPHRNRKRAINLRDSLKDKSKVRSKHSRKIVAVIYELIAFSREKVIPEITDSIGLKEREAYSRKRIEVIDELNILSREMITPEITDNIGLKVGEAYSRKSQEYLFVEIEHIQRE